MNSGYRPYFPDIQNHQTINPINTSPAIFTIIIFSLLP